MTIDALHMPVETEPAGLDILHIGDVGDIAVQLLLVVVGEGDQVAQLPLACSVGCFPDLAFLALSIADDGIGAGVLALDFLSQGDADCCTEPLSQ